jgi:hypothetical protein
MQKVYAITKKTRNVSIYELEIKNAITLELSRCFYVSQRLYLY